MDGKVSKDQAFVWAAGVLKEAVDAGSFGNITFALQGGVIANAKRETTLKPSDVAFKPGIDRQSDKE